MLLTRVRDACASRVWPLALLLTAVAAVALLTSAPGRLISDGQLELYWSPGRVLARQAAAWDPGRGLGSVRTEFWPVPAALLGLLRLLGASAVVAERLWHVALLLAGGLGTIAVLRLRRPRIGIEHAVAALAYMFNPFTVVLLTPWPLFIGYALAPWFVLAFVRGVSEERPWRWAAVIALLVFVPGAVNMVAVGYAALPLVAVALYLVHVERVTDWSRVLGWLARATLLSSLVSLAALVASRTGGSGLAEHVPATPPAESVNRFSSWSESWRGLGYWRTAAQPDGYADSWPLVVASFAIPVAALVALWLVRHRLRLLFGAVMILGLAVAVGMFPIDDPPPIGRLLRSAVEIDALARLRATYLAGPTVLLGVAGLVGLAAAAAAANLRDRRRPLTVIPVVVAAAAVAAGSFPFWTGELYAAVDRADEVPERWQRALAWLDAQPDEGRVLVLGGDGDIVDALLRRPHLRVGDGARLQGTPLSNDLLAALDDHLDSGFYRPGTLTPIARRLGIRYVLLGGADAPAQLRDDPELPVVATFGADISIAEIDGVGGVVRVEPPSAPLLVSGDGSAWPILAARGRLGGADPVRYTAGATPGELADGLERGAELVVTDSDTDAAGPPGTTATVEHGGAILSETGVTDADPERVGRPASAFDGERGTAWLAGAVPEAAALRVDLPQTLRIDELTIARTTGGPRVGAVSVRLSEGDDVQVDLTRPVTTVRFPVRDITWLEVRIDTVVGSGDATPGLAEVVVDDLDLAEEVTLPDDVVRAAARRPELRTLLRTADVTYLMTSPEAAGAHLRRRFHTLGRRSYDVTGSVAITPRTHPLVVVAAAGGGCHGGILSLDGVDVLVRVEEGRFASCAPVSVGGGWHRLVTGDGLLVEGVALRAPTPGPDGAPPPAPPRVEVVAQTATRVRLVVDGPAGSVLTIGQAFHDGWRASMDGESLGPPVPLDTLAAWGIPESGRHEIEVSFAPQRRHDLALLLTLAAVAACAWLAAHRSRS